MITRKALFQIIRDGVVIGTITGIVTDDFPDIIAFSEDAPIQTGDQFRLIQDLDPVVFDLE